MGEDQCIDISVSTIGESYSRFRLVHPGSKITVLDPMRQFGQILPVVVVIGQEPSCYEMIDRFKRLRASRKLELKTIQAKMLSLEVPPIKVAILQLNWEEFVRCFISLIHAVFNITGSQIEAIDGKVLRRWCDRFSRFSE